jgi:tetratricopeptide (TPR) repeat protein
VVRPVKGSPAEAAGLEPGDVITALDGIGVQSTQAIITALEAKGAGTMVRVQLLRAGREITVPVALRPQPEEYALLNEGLKFGRAIKFKEAFTLVQKALELAEKRVGPDDELVGELAFRTAQFQDSLRNPAAAEPLYKRALAIFEKTLGPGDPEVAKVLNGMAFSYRRARREAEAEALYQRSLELLEKAPRPDNLLISDTLRNFAEGLHEGRRAAPARPGFDGRGAGSRPSRGCQLPQHSGVQPSHGTQLC